MTVHLLDVNILLALIDDLHARHEQVHHWFVHNKKAGWATCPFTENGFVRIASTPNYPNFADTAEALVNLQDICNTPTHHFWAANISLRDVLPANHRLTSNQLADVYLLALAIHHNGKLATLDQRIPAEILPNGATAMEVIS